MHPTEKKVHAFCLENEMTAQGFHKATRKGGVSLPTESIRELTSGKKSIKRNAKGESYTINDLFAAARIGLGIKKRRSNGYKVCGLDFSGKNIVTGVIPEKNLNRVIAELSKGNRRLYTIPVEHDNKIHYYLYCGPVNV